MEEQSNTAATPCNHQTAIGEFDFENNKEYLRCVGCGYEWEEDIDLSDVDKETPESEEG